MIKAGWNTWLYYSQAGFVIYWSSRENAGLEPSLVLAVRGSTFWQGNRLWHNTRALCNKRMPVSSLLFQPCFYHTPSSLPLPPISRVLFLWQARVSTVEYKGKQFLLMFVSCNMPPLCSKWNLHFPWDFLPDGGHNCIATVRLIGGQSEWRQCH